MPNPFSISILLSFLECYIKWNHITCDLLRLASPPHTLSLVLWLIVGSCFQILSANPLGLLWLWWGGRVAPCYRWVGWKSRSPCGLPWHFGREASATPNGGESPKSPPSLLDTTLGGGHERCLFTARQGWKSRLPIEHFLMSVWQDCGSFCDVCLG